MACLPAAIASGRLTPLIVTPAAVALAFVMVRFDPPPLDMVTDCEAVLPRDTDPKLIDAGARDMLAAPVVFCWLDATLDAPVNPMHPALESPARSKSRSDANETALLHWRLDCIAHFPAQLSDLFAVLCFILAIVVCGPDWNYCPIGHLWDRE